jgi:hypothetical protein
VPKAALLQQDPFGRGAYLLADADHAAAPEEYYRLTRARELRRKAARLEERAALLERWTGSSCRLWTISGLGLLVMVVAQWFWGRHPF